MKRKTRKSKWLWNLCTLILAGGIMFTIGLSPFAVLHASSASEEEQGNTGATSGIIASQLIGEDAETSPSSIEPLPIPDTEMVLPNEDTSEPAKEEAEAPSSSMEILPDSMPPLAFTAPIQPMALSMAAIEVTTLEGELETAIDTAILEQEGTPADEYPNIASLKVDGTLNDTDFAFIRGNLSGLQTLDLSGLSNVALPDNALRNDSTYANGKLNGLGTVVLPTTMTELGRYAFYNCAALSNIDISNVTKVYERAFYGCSSLGEVDLSKATVIDSFVFAYCANLTLVDGTNLNPSLTSIASGAFYNCFELGVVDLSNLTTIGDSAFGGCRKLTLAAGTNLNPLLIAIGDRTFQDCRLLNDVDLSNVKYLKYGSFMNCTILTLKAGTNLNPALTNIPSKAFEGCAELGVVNLSSIKTIGSEAFKSCRKLTLADGTNLNPALTYIPNDAFFGCEVLGELDLSQIKRIDEYAFLDCKNLTLMPGTNLNPALTTISRNSFYKCIALTGVDLSHVTTISAYAFQGCKALTEVDLSNATTIQSYAFASCAKLKLAPGTNLNPSLSQIHSNVFYSCTELTGVDLSNITSIGESAFSFCTSLTEADLRNVTRVNTFGFYGCTGLTSLDLSKVTYIGVSAFYQCTGLKAIALNTTKPTIETSAFAYVSPLLLLVDGGGAYADIKGFANGSNYATITGNTALTLGQALSLAVSPNVGDGGVCQYQWYKGTDILTGENARTFSKTNIQASDSGTYSCRVTLGSLTVEKTAVVTVNPLNAETPTITNQPQGGRYGVGDTPTAITVLAEVADGGTLSYQWYKNTVDSTTGGTAVGTNSASYLPPTSTEGTVYYYAVITNTNPNATAVKKVSRPSQTAEVEVLVITNAQAPTLTTQPQRGSYMVGDTATAITVSAEVADGGTLSYQWYKNTVDSTTGGTAVGTNSASYLPPTSTEGTVYYYAVITNTNPNATGLKIASTPSQTAEVEVIALTNAQTPTITTQPQGGSYIVKSDAKEITVSAEVTDGGVLSYQWYKNTEDSTTGGTEIGTNTASLRPPTSEEGKVYYYAVVTNHNPDATGVKTASKTSQTAEISVSKEGISPAITTTVLPNASLKSSYLQTLAGTGTSPLVWEVLSGSLPKGLSLESRGTITGIPTEAGLYSFTIMVANGYEPAATRQFTIEVGAYLPVHSFRTNSFTTAIEGTAGLEGTVDADFETFIGLYINGVELSRPEQFEARSGSTIITLKPDYLATLESGVYLVEAYFTDGGVARTNLVIPQANTVPPVTPQATAYTISTAASDGGIISPLGDTQVENGSDFTVYVSPHLGYTVSSVTVDGETIQSHDNRYTFTNISGDHKIEATFTQANGIPSTGDGNSMLRWVVLVLGSAVACICLLMLQRRQKPPAKVGFYKAKRQ